MSLSQAKALAISRPNPPYPYEARKQRLTGSGVMLMHIDPASGDVTEVTVQKSCGSSILDDAAVSGLKRWRFRPGTAPKVTAPITFTLTGASL
jgi:protein TonB